MESELYIPSEAFMEAHLMTVSIADLPMTERVYRVEHSKRVARYARNIARAEKLDETVCLLAGILHDVGKFESERNRDHGRVSAQIAEPFVMTLPVSQRKRSDILYCIASHCDGEAGYCYEPIPEAGAVRDADWVDRLGVYRVIQALSYDGFGEMDLKEKIDYCKRRGQWLKEHTEREMNTPEGTRLFRQACQVQLGYFQKMENELLFTLSGV